MFGIHVVKMDEEVTVSFGGVEHKVEIDDVNQEDLKDLFGIDFEIKHLLEVETQKTILIKKTEKLKPGFTYVIENPKKSNKSSKPSVLDNWTSKNQALVQNALICSKGKITQVNL